MSHHVTKFIKSNDVGTGSKNSERCLFDYSENHFSAMHAPTQASAGQKNDFQSNQTKTFRIFDDSSSRVGTVVAMVAISL